MSSLLEFFTPFYVMEQNFQFDWLIQTVNCMDFVRTPGLEWIRPNYSFTRPLVAYAVRLLILHVSLLVYNFMALIGQPQSYGWRSCK